MENDLFGPVNYISIDKAILGKARDGILFFSVSQSSKLLGLSECQVRYAIENYRLDAFLIAGEYRIPFNALLRYSEDDLKAEYLSYFNVINDLAISGVYEMNFKGKLSPIIDSLKSRNMPIEAISILLDKIDVQDYSKLPSIEENPMDWYSIDELRLPLYGCVAEYASIIGSRAKDFAREMSCDIRERISYGEVYDFLVEHEVVNLPVPFSVSNIKEEPEESKQLMLF